MQAASGIASRQSAEATAFASSCVLDAVRDEGGGDFPEADGFWSLEKPVETGIATNRAGHRRLHVVGEVLRPPSSRRSGSRAGPGLSSSPRGQAAMRCAHG